LARCGKREVVARQLISTQGPLVEPQAESLAACLTEGKQGFWLDIENPDASDYELLEKTFKFHPLALEDIRHQNQRPKLDEYTGYVFVVLFTAEFDGERIQIREQHLFLSPQYLVSVHLEPSPPLDLRKVLGAQRDVFQRLTTHTVGFEGGQDMTIYYRDVYDHIIRQYETVDSLRDLLTSAMDVYLSTVSNRLNQVITRLTVFATLFLPLTFITGLFGMNFAWLVAHIAPAWTFWVLAVA